MARVVGLRVPLVGPPMPLTTTRVVAATRAETLEEKRARAHTAVPIGTITERVIATANETSEKGIPTETEKAADTIHGTAVTLTAEVRLDETSFTA